MSQICCWAKLTFNMVCQYKLLKKQILRTFPCRYSRAGRRGLSTRSTTSRSVSCPWSRAYFAKSPPPANSSTRTSCLSCRKDANRQMMFLCCSWECSATWKCEAQHAPWMTVRKLQVRIHQLRKPSVSVNEGFDFKVDACKAKHGEKSMLRETWHYHLSQLMQSICICFTIKCIVTTVFV